MNRFFFFVWILLSFILIPYVFYTMKVYFYAQHHQPKGYNYPHLKDLWVVAAGVFVWGIVQRLMLATFTPFISRVVKGQNDPELKAKYTKKSSEAMVKIVFFGSMCIWCS